jgi:hypothetical protein
MDGTKGSKRGYKKALRFIPEELFQWEAYLP